MTVKEPSDREQTIAFFEGLSRETLTLAEATKEDEERLERIAQRSITNPAFRQSPLAGEKP